MAKQTILEMLKTADIEAMETELQELEGKLELATRQFKTDIEALKMSIKLANVAQHGKPDRKPRQKKSDAPKVTNSQATPVSRKGTLCDRSATYLEAAGEATATAICRGIGHDNEGSLRGMLQMDNRFLRTEKGTYRLRGHWPRVSTINQL